MPKLVKLLTNALELLHKQIAVYAKEWLHQKNPEALHNLRISLRQLRSLLNPLRSEINEFKALDQFSKKIITATNRIRDIEVLIQELKREQKTNIVTIYEQKLQSKFLDIDLHPELESITLSLTMLASNWQKTITSNIAHKLELHIAKHRQKQSHKLFKLLQQNDPDKHRLRILIKRLRYHSEIYRALLPKQATQQTEQLKKLQDLLGNWHDYYVWLNEASQCQELETLAPIWREQLQYCEKESDLALKKLKLKNFI